MKLAVVIIASLLAVSFSADCNNPLLADATIKANIGSSNVATSVQTAASSLPICKWLAGKSVCASSYDTLKSSIDKQKSDFKTASDARNKARWGDVDLDIDVEDCVETTFKILAYWAWAATHGFSGSSTTSISFNGLQASAAAYVEAGKQTGLWDEAVKEGKAQVDAVDDHIAAFIAGKANCTAAVFDWVIYQNCLATDADYSGKVTGSGSGTQIWVKDGTCASYITRCKQYFNAGKHVGGIANMAAMCNNPTIAAAVADIDADYSDAVNNRLNNYLTNQDFVYIAANILGGEDGVSVTANANSFVGLSCDNDHPNAHDCNFICDDVLVTGGSGFRANAYLNLNEDLSTRRARLLQSNHGPAESASAPDMFAQTANEDSSVEEDADPVSSGVKLFMSLSFLLGLIYVL